METKEYVDAENLSDRAAAAADATAKANAAQAAAEAASDPVGTAAALDAPIARRLKYTLAGLERVHMLNTTNLGGVDLGALAALPGGATQGDVNTRLNALKIWWNAHLPSAPATTTADLAHDAADAANLITSADAADLATSITLLNEMKLDLIGHGNQAGVHLNDDAALVAFAFTGADPPVVLADCITDANDVLAALQAHAARASE